MKPLNSFSFTTQFGQFARPSPFGPASLAPAPLAPVPLTPVTLAPVQRPLKASL